MQNDTQEPLTLNLDNKTLKNAGRSTLAVAGLFSFIGALGLVVSFQQGDNLKIVGSAVLLAAYITLFFIGIQTTRATQAGMGLRNLTIAIWISAFIIAFSILVGVLQGSAKGLLGTLIVFVLFISLLVWRSKIKKQR
jgi:hypothetical protein